jgi:predicted dehydrogenase/nucleoside-diphosphate-sugar epimerase
MTQVTAVVRPATPLGVAIVGAGKMAAQHAGAIARLGELARVVAVADPLPAARATVRTHAPDAAEYDNLAALLGDRVPDVVHVCTPAATHVKLAETALERGSHIYVEKPFAETVATAERLLAAARAKGVLVCAGHQLLFERPARQALALLPALGQLVHVESYFSFRAVRRGPGGGAPMRADHQLLDVLPHPVYLLLRFLESPGDRGTEVAALDVGRAGTVHALLRNGDITGSLVVTLEGRPIESYLRLVGTNGMLHADFVRGTVQRLFGPGTSTIDKLLAPYRLAWQGAAGATGAFATRVLRRQRSYPGLAELLEAFYRAIVEQRASPVSPQSILDTVAVCEQVASRIAEPSAAPATPGVHGPRSPRVAVTGGTGFLGQALVRRLLDREAAVRVLCRRAPAPWARVSGAEYIEVDLGDPIPPGLLRGVTIVLHAAAETAGGWDAHQRNSIDATRHVLRAAAEAGVQRVVCVSSLAVLASGRGAISEDTPLEAQSRGSGPYVWGKLESERTALALGEELGVRVKIVRPGAIVDYAAFEPPGRLGKGIGPLFVAVGSPRDRLGVVDLNFTADTLAWYAEEFDAAPSVLNLIGPELPTKRELLTRLRVRNPDVRVIWLPRIVLTPVSAVATGLQRLVRRGRPAVSLRKVFAVPHYDTTRSHSVAERIAAWQNAGPSASGNS